MANRFSTEETEAIEVYTQSCRAYAEAQATYWRYPTAENLNKLLEAKVTRGGASVYGFEIDESLTKKDRDANE